MKTRMISAQFLRRFACTFSVFVLPLAAPAAPQWIWSTNAAKSNETVTVRREFAIAGEVKSATLAFTCDNSSKAFLNGQAAGSSSAWSSPHRQDVKMLVRPGTNELRIEGRNEEGVAGVVATLAIELANGTKLAIETNAEWQAAPAGGAGWKPAVIIAKHGDAPWGAVLTGGGGRGRVAEKVADPASLAVPPGFTVELLYTVPKEQQGSWISITPDPKGRLITCDQYGAIYRVTPPPPGQAGESRIEPLKTDVAGAHGLLYAFNSLYVMVNEKEGRGLWRLRDLDGDDQFEKAELLRKIEGSGEHGPHGVVPGPDGKSLYFVCGNHTKLPDKMELSRAARAWNEDHLLPRLWDANGHAKGILAPGGYICKTDPEGRTIELFTAGFRNSFDLAFDANGELFTFDSDMEWDIGTPWYRPTRVAHCTSAGELGWRSGAGIWPDYYPDSQPPTLDVGPGSPTGVVFGTGAKFPAKYQRAFFACDWTYGTMYAIHLVPHGASFRAEKEEFVAGKSLPLTDAVIAPDGAMYFTTGGRKTQSALYRVTYTGNESTAPAPRLAITPEARLRHDLEALHLQGTGPEAVGKAWPHLGHADRFIRFAARVAIERQSASLWADRAFAEKNPQSAIEALLALARVGDKSLQPRLLESLAHIDVAKVTPELRLPLLRVWQLAFTRMGKPAPEVCAQLATKFDALFPHPEAAVNRELLQLLVFLDSPRIVAKTVALLSTSRDDHEDIAADSLLERNTGYASAARAMHKTRPNRQQIAYAYSLRNARAGWTPQLRKAFFAWFPRTREWKGGNSFTKFLDNIRTEALANTVTDPAERATLDELSKKGPPPAPAQFVMPKGPGRNYSVEEIVALARDGLKGRNFEHGKAMYASTLCATCHHLGGDGGNVGPDLTGAGNRYTLHDLVENIVEPSKVISDQYGSEQVELKNGNTVIGRVTVEENGKLFVMASPLTPDEITALPVADVKSRQPYPVSMMPPGLINPLNSDELLDLLAYLQSGGNPKDKAFTK